MNMWQKFNIEKAAAERTTKQIVRGYIDKLLNEPELKYVLDIMRQDDRIL